MKEISLEDVIRAVNGVININVDTSNISINNVVIDSRKVADSNNINLNKDLFIPIAGDNFDAHDFIDDVFERGAVCSLSEKEVNNSSNIIIKVDSTREALKDLARFYISLFDIKVVALTGSSGKTTTKDMIASCLSQKYNVTKTEGNFNNEIGLPLTIFNINDKTEVAVLEMGMNAKGEIHELSKIAKPNIALITNIGLAHIENFQDNQENIFRAKYEIFDYLKKDGIKVLNYDSEFLCDLEFSQDIGISKEQHFYSLSNSEKTSVYPLEIVQKDIQNTFVKVSCFGEIFDFNLNCSGNHMVSNALASVLIGYKLGLSSHQIKNGLETFKLSKMRMEIINNDKYTIINDVYNANPTSMKAVIDVLASVNNIKGSRKVAILGDMFELGEKLTNKLHYEVGIYVANKDIDLLICVGIYSKYIYKGALDYNIKEAHYFETKDEFLNKYKSLLFSKDVILLKASRGMEFEKIVYELI